MHTRMRVGFVEKLIHRKVISQSDIQQQPYFSLVTFHCKKYKP